LESERYPEATLLYLNGTPVIADMNGDSALHWAAYKGFPGLMQVLAINNHIFLLILC
jgi:hypothetical protein